MVLVDRRAICGAYPFFFVKFIRQNKQTDDLHVRRYLRSLECPWSA